MGRPVDCLAVQSRVVPEPAHVPQGARYDPARGLPYHHQDLSCRLLGAFTMPTLTPLLHRIRLSDAFLVMSMYESSINSDAGCGSSPGAGVIRHALPFPD
jgi:hypothetical protein